MAFSHRSTSNSDTLSVRSYGSSSRGSTRLIVVLPDDTLTDSYEIGVPVPESMTISELQREALRRARALGLTIHKGDFNLRLDSHNGPIAFPEDVVFDVVDTGFAAKVWLVPTVAASKSSKHQAKEVYIRWITPARALDFPTLSSIPPDLSPISRETTISELKGIAADRNYDGPSSTEAPLPSKYQVQLFLTECPLCMTNEKDIRIGDLLCDTEGSLQHPLDIYIVPISGKPSDADSPETLWAFESTKRGTAAFLTCLKLAINQARKATSDAPKRRLLKAYFRVTHFTPALTAIYTLLEENKLEPDSVAILATCFRELALRMVPSELIGHSVKAVLEGSRQIFAWLDSELCETPGEIDDPEAALVRSIEFKEITDDQILNEYRVGKRCDIVEFKASGDPMRTGSSSEPRKIRQVKVWTAANCKQNVRLLALAMWGHYDPSGDFYVDFRDNMKNPFDERRIPLTSRREFPRLLAEANSHPHLRMTGPKDLQNFPTAITLSTEGYVSVFDQNEGYCKDVRPTIWNAVSGTEMLDSSFIKTLETALEPIIKQRKVEGTWGLDDWQYTAKSQSVDVTPHEAIVICFDLSYSMTGSLGHEWIGAPNDFNKLLEIKQVFQNVIARMVGYHLLSNYIGVITFSNRNLVTVTTELTQLSKLPEDFKDMMGNKKATGRTALWDAVGKAKDMLLAFKQKHPKSKLRIIALTDGEDNESQKNPSDLCRELYEAEIVFDSLAVGSGKTSDLFKISKHTGGYAFRPTSRMLLYQIFLLEPFLDISVRPDIERVPLGNYYTSSPKEPDMKTTYDFPRCRPHPLEKGSFISVSDCGRFFPSRSVSQNQTRTSSLARWLAPRARSLADSLPNRTVHPRALPQSDTLSVTSDRSTMSSGRVLMKEIDFIILNQESYFDVYVNESDMSFWKVVMAGPVGSPYDKGNFVLSVCLTETFPQTPPLVRFLTPVLHPNITKHGRVCHAIFTKNWKTSYHVHTVLQYMYELLKDPEPNDAIDELATIKFWTDQATADAEIRKYVEKFATQTRDALKSGILKV